MTQIRQETLNRMKELTELHAVPGFENEVREYLKEKWHHLLMKLSVIIWAVFMV